ncbi:ATP-binding protein [Chloroflexota bacterium]
MPTGKLFNQRDIVGIFRGFREGGLEFHADIVLPYRSDFQRIPMHGQFVLVQLESQDEAVMGRITSFSSQGRLSSSSGEEFNIRAVQEERVVPEDLREQYLRYAVNIRVLGVIRCVDGKIQFIPSHRRLPHVGSPVAFPSGEVLQEIAGHNIDGATIGLFSLGEYVYAMGSKYVSHLDDWVQIREPNIEVKFPVSSLVSRRSFIFARAGFGKSNLNKLLFSMLYAETPTIKKRGDRDVPVGTIIFDPDGEYFWPDDRGRPGLADVPELEDKLVVFTPRHSTSPFYQSFVAGGIKLDLRRLRPSDVIAIALSPERQTQQNVGKLRGLSQEKWEQIVNVIDINGNQTPLEDIKDIIGLEDGQDAEALAARANMTTIVRMLHDRSSQFMDLLFASLRSGKLCVVDTSQMRSGQALVLSGLILRRIFDHNQEEFTSAEPKTIPTIMVVEEAQTVLDQRSSGSEPYISWVKEGRKYDLGALMITQQPGSIPMEILSQGDNWFIFHLLSGTDLQNVRNANAHFSNDLLSALLNEPIPGHGVFWSSVGGSPYPISIRILSFEKLYTPLDPDYNRPSAATYAIALREEFENALRSAGVDINPKGMKENDSDTDQAEYPEDQGIDVIGSIEKAAINKLRDDKIVERIKSEEGIAWGGLKAFLIGQLPVNLEDRDNIAYNLVLKAMDEIMGERNVHWYSYRNPNRNNTTYIRSGRNPNP